MGTIKAAREEMNEEAFMFARVSDPCMDTEHKCGSLHRQVSKKEREGEGVKGKGWGVEERNR